ncbi:Alpha/Beta hydrolase protein [Blyttiomyces helicus]|uniref:Alpha/Beta hydrolase protein n=1 Tax=Blyttiomyces helicus TaxID=388810 RepID=A0A4P9VWW0_9FUNG|nr:Alpha/Beta hydrolase protein [Blyttiomyces helicus]|eukprot:RKO82748.1 Alpha/Beta hydrolase protein [Blyttiomyces helicus]
MLFCSSVAMAIFGLSGTLAAPARRSIVPINGDCTTPSGPVPAATVSDIVRFVGWSGAAYGNASSIESWTCPRCDEAPMLDNITVIEGSSFLDINAFQLEQAFIGVDNERQNIVVSFRGTIQTVADWLNDFDAVFVSADYLVSGALISQGMSKAYESVREKVTASLQDYVSANPGFTISFTGHSLGGGKLFPST